jgi:hypothetical protein
MTSQRDRHLGTLRSIRQQVLDVLEGMDYCLDWKPEPEAWSAREVVYHLVDTPAGGIGAVLQGILSGELREFQVTPDRTNLTAERQTSDLEQVRREAVRVLDEVESAVSGADDEALAGKSAVAHLTARSRSEERTAQMLLEGLFARHWREHLGQLQLLRDTLGV